MLSNKVKLEVDDGALGRFWVAKKKIAVGTLLVCESPVANVPNLIKQSLSHNNELTYLSPLHKLVRITTDSDSNSNSNSNSTHNSNNNNNSNNNSDNKNENNNVPSQLQTDDEQKSEESITPMHFCWQCCSIFNTPPLYCHYCSEDCYQKNRDIYEILYPKKESESAAYELAAQCDGMTLQLAVTMLIKMYRSLTDNPSLMQQWTDFRKDAPFLTMTQFFQKYPNAFYTALNVTSAMSTATHNELLSQNLPKNKQTRLMTEIESLQNEILSQHLLQCGVTNALRKDTQFGKNCSTLKDSIIPKLFTYLSSSSSSDNNLSLSDLQNLGSTLLALIYYNGFGLRYSVLHDDLMLGLSLYVYASFFNHSCAPNAFYYFVNGNTVCIRTLKEIKMNEPITISIVADLESQPQYQREKVLQSNFGFKCQCNRCTDEEYTTNDSLLVNRSTVEEDCIMNAPKHLNLLKYARTMWSSATEDESSMSEQAPGTAWKFYRRLFEKYEYFYHPFDPQVLAILQEISQRAWMVRDYEIGFRAAELGKEYSARMVSCSLMDNCHLTEFRFMFLSLLHYVYWLQQERPQSMSRLLADHKSNVLTLSEEDLVHQLSDDVKMSELHSHSSESGKNTPNPAQRKKKMTRKQQQHNKGKKNKQHRHKQKASAPASLSSSSSFSHPKPESIQSSESSQTKPEEESVEHATSVAEEEQVSEEKPSMAPQNEEQEDTKEQENTKEEEEEEEDTKEQEAVITPAEKAPKKKRRRRGKKNTANADGQSETPATIAVSASTSKFLKKVVAMNGTQASTASSQGDNDKTKENNVDKPKPKPKETAKPKSIRPAPPKRQSIAEIVAEAEDAVASTTDHIAKKSRRGKRSHGNANKHANKHNKRKVGHLTDADIEEMLRKEKEELERQRIAAEEAARMASWREEEEKEEATQQTGVATSDKANKKPKKKKKGKKHKQAQQSQSKQKQSKQKPKSKPKSKASAQHSSSSSKNKKSALDDAFWAQHIQPSDKKSSADGSAVNGSATAAGAAAKKGGQKGKFRNGDLTMEDVRRVRTRKGGSYMGYDEEELLGGDDETEVNELTLLDENELEEDFTDKMAEFMSARACLFPQFNDFRSWIGSDLMAMESRLSDIVEQLQFRALEHK